MMTFIAGVLVGSIGASVTLLFVMGARMNERCYECRRGQYRVDKD